MYDNELYHYGVKGMHWGVRKDETSKAFAPSKNKKGQYTNAPTPGEIIARSGSQATTDTQRLVDKVFKDKYQDPSTLSNDELRKRIERRRLEQQYVEYEKYSSRGKQAVKDFLDVSGTVLAIGASGAVIGREIYKIKHSLNADGSDELYHYGVKGMHWGVRKYQNEDGSYTPAGEKRYGGSGESRGFSGGKASRNWKLARNVMLGAAGITAAAVVGIEAHKLGKMSADRVLKKGALLQSVAEADRDFSKPFYYATRGDDRRKILKEFSPVIQDQKGSAHAYMFKANSDISIAGRKAQKAAYKDAFGTTKGFNKFANTLTFQKQEKKDAFNDAVRRAGYDGYKDIAGMRKWWSRTPEVLLSTNKVDQVNSPEIKIDVAKKIKTKYKMTKVQDAEDKLLKQALPVGAAGVVGAETGVIYADRKNKKGNKK